MRHDALWSLFHFEGQYLIQPWVDAYGVHYQEEQRLAKDLARSGAPIDLYRINNLGRRQLMVLEHAYYHHDVSALRFDNLRRLRAAINRTLAATRVSVAPHPWRHEGF